jgi:hypothetical protein
MKESGGFIP